MTWDEWVAKHALLFGMRQEDDIPMLSEWAKIFDHGGFTADELYRVSQSMAAGGEVPKFRDGHVAALQRGARALRARGERESVKEDPERPECPLCGSAGMVSVPNPDALRRNRWGTMYVLCKCPLGIWISQQKTSHGQMTLRQYECIDPDWQEVVEHHEWEIRQWAKARVRAGVQDARFGQLDRIVQHILHRETQGKTP